MNDLIFGIGSGESCPVRRGQSLKPVDCQPPGQNTLADNFLVNDKHQYLYVLNSNLGTMIAYKISSLETCRDNGDRGHLGV